MKISEMRKKSLSIIMDLASTHNMSMITVEFKKYPFGAKSVEDLPEDMMIPLAGYQRWEDKIEIYEVPMVNVVRNDNDLMKILGHEVIHKKLWDNDIIYKVNMNCLTALFSLSPRRLKKHIDNIKSRYAHGRRFKKECRKYGYSEGRVFEYK